MTALAKIMEAPCKIDHSDPESIPLFLCCQCTPRPRGVGATYAAPVYVDPVLVEQQRLREKFKADDKAKARARIAKMKAKMGTDDPDADILG